MGLKIGELVALLTVDDNQFTRGVAGAKKALTSLGSHSVGVSKTIALNAAKAALAVTAIGAAGSLGVAGLAGGLALGVGGLGVMLAMSDKVKKSFATFGSEALKAFKAAAAPLQGPLLAGLAQLSTRIAPLAKSLGMAFTAAAPLIKTVFDTIITVVDSLAANLPKIVAAGVPVAQFLVTVLGGALSGLFNGIAWLIDKFNLFKTALTSGSGTISAWGAMIGGIVAQVKAIFGDVFGAVSAWVQANQGTIQGWVDAVKSGFTSLMGAVSSALDAIKGIWDVWGGTILTVVGGIISAVTGVFSGLMEALKGIFEVFAGIFTGDWSRAWNGVKSIFSGVWNAIKALFSGLLTALGAIASKGWELIKGAASAAWNGIKTVVSKAWDALTGAVSTGVAAAVKFVTELPGKLLKAVGATNTLLLQAGKDLINGLINGVKAMVGKLLDIVKGAINSAIDGAKKLLGISSPSRVFMTIGQMAMAGMVNGINKGGAAVVDAAKKIAKQTAQVVQGAVTSGPYGIAAAQGEIARLLGNAHFGLAVQAVTPTPEPTSTPRPTAKPKPRSDPNDVTFDRGPSKPRRDPNDATTDRNPPKKDNAGYVQPSAFTVNNNFHAANMSAGQVSSIMWMQAHAAGF